MDTFNQRANVSVEAILYDGTDGSAEAVITAGGGVIFPGRQGRLMIDPPANPNHARQGDTRAYGHLRDNLSSPWIIFPGEYVVYDTARSRWFSMDPALFEALYEAA